MSNFIYIRLMKTDDADIPQIAATLAFGDLLPPSPTNTKTRCDCIG